MNFDEEMNKEDWYNMQVQQVAFSHTSVGFAREEAVLTRIKRSNYFPLSGGVTV
jgi:hypothetical protein